MTDTIILLETNIDDCSSEVLGYTLEKLFDIGVKDAWFTPIFMKKNRPAYSLSVMCKEDVVDDAIKVIFKHTSAVGLRKSTVDRVIMDREPTDITTKYGPVKANKFTYEDIEKVSIEYSSAKELADKNDISINEVLS